MNSIIRLSLMVLLAMGPATAAANSTQTEVIVDKTSRTLWVVSDGRVQASFPFSLGPNPVGHKLSLGDGRTPEGSYKLTTKLKESRYYKSIHITYPNSADRKLAASRGVHPGGQIKIHGLPNNAPFDAIDYLAFDWTEGCIAVSNDAMDTLWDMISHGTPIHIYPDITSSGSITSNQ